MPSASLQAVKALRRATLLLVDDLVGDGVLRCVRRSARVVRVGKRGGCKSTPQACIHKLMIAEARRGERVVRLKGGDPFVFGRGGEECDALRAAGIEVDVVSGLTAGIAGPAAIGVPVTDRRYTHGVVLVTGHAGRNGNQGGGPDWNVLARCGLTLVIYMGVARLPLLVEALARGGMAPDTPAAIISAAHTPRQRQALCTLGSLVHTVEREGLGSAAILVLGDVVQAAPMVAHTPMPAQAAVQQALPGRFTPWAATASRRTPREAGYVPACPAG